MDAKSKPHHDESKMSQDSEQSTQHQEKGSASASANPSESTLGANPDEIPPDPDLKKGSKAELETKSVTSSIASEVRRESRTESEASAVSKPRVSGAPRASAISTGSKARRESRAALHAVEARESAAHRASLASESRKQSKAEPRVSGAPRTSFAAEPKRDGEDSTEEPPRVSDAARKSIGGKRESLASAQTGYSSRISGSGTGVRFNPTEAPGAADKDAFRDLDIDDIDGELFEEGQVYGAGQDRTFRKLQDIYNRTIDGLEQSESHGVDLEPVKDIFRNVWDAIERSHENVLKLRKKDHVLSVEISTAMAKTRTLIKLAEDDQAISAALKGKLETAWGLADIGEQEEKKVLEKINEFRDEIAVLNRSIDAAQKTEGQETIAELNKVKHTLEAERANLMTDAAKLHSSTERVKTRREELANTFVTLKDQLEITEKETQMQNEEIEAQNMKKEELDREIIRASRDIGEKIQELEAMDSNVSAAQDRLAEAEAEVQTQRAINEEAAREREVAVTRFEKMKEDYEIQKLVNEKLVKDVQIKEDELKARETDLKDVQHDMTLVTREYNANVRKAAVLKTNLERLEKDRDALKVELVELEQTMELSQKNLDNNRREVHDLDRERSHINRDLQKANAVVNDRISQAKTHQVAVRNLEVELTAYEKEITMQQETIARLERERDNYSHEATKLAHQVAQRLDDIKKLDIAIYEYQRKLGEVETQLKKQEQILDATEHEKSLLTRTLRETASEIKENSRKLTHLGHQITALKFQLNEKDAIIHEASQNYERIQKDTNFFTNESKRIKRLEYDLERQIDGLAVERSTLGRMVAEIEGEISKQKYYARSAESRRDVYFRKLVAKEKQVRDAWEKWRTLHSTIRIGVYHIRNVKEEIRKLHYYIFLSKKEKLVFKDAARTAQKLKHDIAVLENLISREICMRNALREQMKHPINVHRWRVLECVHPKSYELVQKSNILTKRLVDRNILLTKQAEDLTLKQQIYVQIRGALHKSPGLEVPENVRYYTHLLTAKRKQLSTLRNELKEAEAQRDFFKYEIEGVRKRFMNLKDKYFKRVRNPGKWKPDERTQETLREHETEGEGYEPVNADHSGQPHQIGPQHGHAQKALRVEKQMPEPEHETAGQYQRAVADIESLVRLYAEEKVEDPSHNLQHGHAGKVSNTSFEKYLF